MSAVSPMTTPMPWSMKNRRPICAPGWISIPVSQRAEVRHEAGEPFEPAGPQPMRGAMDQHGVKAGIAGEYFPGRCAPRDRVRKQRRFLPGDERTFRVKSTELGVGAYDVLVNQSTLTRPATGYGNRATRRRVAGDCSSQRAFLGMDERLEKAAQDVDFLFLELRAAEEAAQARHQLLVVAGVEKAGLEKSLQVRVEDLQLLEAREGLGRLAPTSYREPPGAARRRTPAPPRRD